MNGSARIFLLRHAESEWNVQGRWAGRGDPPLTDEGRARAKLAADRLGDVVPPIFASPLRRATETAGIMADVLGLEVEIEDGLLEWDAGEWTGLTNAEIEARFPDEFVAWKEGWLRRYPGGDDRTTYHETVIAAVRRIVGPREGRSTVAVSHAGAIQSLERHLGVHPGRSLRQLEGRWFDVGSDVRAAGERIALDDRVVDPGIR